MYSSMTITNPAWSDIAAWCRAADRRGLETGYRLLGIRTIAQTQRGVELGLHVGAAVGPGPAAVATSYSFSGDVAYQQAEFSRIRRARPDWTLISEGHLHPSSLPTPSMQDVRMACAMARDPGYALPHGVMPIVIATVQRGRVCLRGFAIGDAPAGPVVTEFRIHTPDDFSVSPPAPQPKVGRGLFPMFRRFS